MKCDSSDSVVPTPSADWRNYQVFIMTPTNSTGLSCNDAHFDVRMCYFPYQSCEAETCTQMIYRVRNCPFTEIHFSERVKYGPMTTEKVVNWVDKRMTCWKDFGLKCSIRKTYEKNAYYWLYVEYVKKRNMSCFNLRDLVTRLLQLHGVEIEDADELEEAESLKEETKRIGSEIKLEDAESVVEAQDIDSLEYAEIDAKTVRTLEEKLSMRKFPLRRDFDVEVNVDNVLLLEPHLRHFKNLKIMKHFQNYPEWVEERRGDRVESLGNQMHLKMKVVDDFVKQAGF